MIGPPGELEALAESLLSTEHGADGLPRRIGLELYHDRTDRRFGSPAR